MTFKTVCVECGIVLEGDPEADPIPDMCRRCYTLGLDELEQREFNFDGASKVPFYRSPIGEDLELEGRRHQYMMGYDDEEK